MHALKFDEEALKRVIIMGYGQMRPIVPNRTPAGEPIAENQAKNRRVTIRIF